MCDRAPESVPSSSPGCQDFQRTALDHELYERRSLVRVRCMRGTSFCCRSTCFLLRAATRQLVLGPSTKYLMAQGLTLGSYELRVNRRMLSPPAEPCRPRRSELELGVGRRCAPCSAESNV